MSAKSLIRRVGREPKRRRGAAAVEFAIVLPLLLVMTIGTIDLCTMMFLKESAVLAAYEGARRGVGRDETNADVISRITEFLDEREIAYNGADVVEISGPGFDGAAALENITVTVNVPAAGNLLMPSDMIGDLILSADVTMRKEYANLN